MYKNKYYNDENVYSVSSLYLQRKMQVQDFYDNNKNYLDYIEKVYGKYDL